MQSVRAFLAGEYRNVLAVAAALLGTGALAGVAHSGMMNATCREGEPMSAVNEETRISREEAILRIRAGIRAAQLRVALDKDRGRQTPVAVERLAQRTPPKLPSPFDALRTSDGKPRRDPASRREMALYFRRGIRAAQLRIALDEQRGRPTPEAVKRLAQRKLPTLE